MGQLPHNMKLITCIVRVHGLCRCIPCPDKIFKEMRFLSCTLNLLLVIEFWCFLVRSLKTQFYPFSYRCHLQLPPPGVSEDLPGRPWSKQPARGFREAPSAKPVELFLLHLEPESASPVLFPFPSIARERAPSELFIEEIEHRLAQE